MKKNPLPPASTAQAATNSVVIHPLHAVAAGVALLIASAAAQAQSAPTPPVEGGTLEEVRVNAQAEAETAATPVIGFTAHRATTATPAAPPSAAASAPRASASAPGAATESATDGEDGYVAVLPTVVVTGTAETSATKGYVGYEEADVTRNQRPVKEVPQTIDVLDIQKNKNYGTNDLSAILEGNAGIDAAYDMRGESILIRGFSADASDIYRDGVRESGQVRRSTANIERVEILKGPASVLYGRSAGGGVINMVSKFADFNTRRSVGLGYGSWAQRTATLDINQKVNEHVALRLTGEVARANSFRSAIHSRGEMLSPSVTVRAGQLSWTGQYTYDSAWRVPDRGPTKNVYAAMGVPYDQGFARPGDFVRDDLRVWRSDLNYALSSNWDLRWQLAHRDASQDFDHYFGGTYNAARGVLDQSYAWQETSNQTLSSALTLNGRVKTGGLTHHLTMGLDLSRERRDPTLATLRNQAIDPFSDPASWPRVNPRPPATTINRHRGNASGLFIQDLIGLTPTLKVLVGGRYDRYEFGSTDINSKHSSYRGSAFSPNAGVVWDITPTHTAYASWNKSFAPYGGNGYLGVTATADPATFNASPEQSRQFEVGIKSEWLDRRLSTTLSIYDLERANIRYRPNPDDLTHWAVRGKERSRGIELSTLGRVHPQWYLRGSLGLMSAKVVEDKASPQREGWPLNNTSRVTSNLFVRYAPRPWYAEVGVTHLGKRLYTTSQGTPENLPGFTRVDAMVGYTHANWNFTFAVHNVFNTRYWRASSMPGSPRAFTLKGSYQF